MSAAMAIGVTYAVFSECVNTVIRQRGAIPI